MECSNEVATRLLGHETNDVNINYFNKYDFLDLIDLFDNEFKVIVQLLNEDPYKKPFIGIEDDMMELDVIERFEVNALHLILEYCKLADYVSFGVEPLIALYIRKNEELRILRTIYLGRKNNFSKEQIKKLL